MAIVEVPDDLRAAAATADRIARGARDLWEFAESGEESARLAFVDVAQGEWMRWTEGCGAVERVANEMATLRIAERLGSIKLPDGAARSAHEGALTVMHLLLDTAEKVAGGPNDLPVEDRLSRFNTFWPQICESIRSFGLSDADFKNLRYEIEREMTLAAMARQPEKAAPADRSASGSRWLRSGSGQVVGRRHDASIPSSKRTRPMNLTTAARLMGYKGADQERARRLSKLVMDGTVSAERLNRQTYVFNIDDFPKNNHQKALPSA